MRALKDPSRKRSTRSPALPTTPGDRSVSRDRSLSLGSERVLILLRAAPNLRPGAAAGTPSSNSLAAPRPGPTNSGNCSALRPTRSVTRTAGRAQVDRVGGRPRTSVGFLFPKPGGAGSPTHVLSRRESQKSCPGERTNHPRVSLVSRRAVLERAVSC